MSSGFNHVRVRKSHSRNTVMVTPVEEEGADRWADIMNPGVARAIASAHIVDDECNGNFPPDHPANLALLNTLGHIDLLRRGPELTDMAEPRPTLPSRFRTSQLIRFVDLTAYNSHDPDKFWRTRPIAELMARPPGATQITLNFSFDPRHPRLREASFSAYFIGLSDVTVILTPYERVAVNPPDLGPGGTVTPASAGNTPSGSRRGSPAPKSDKDRPGFVTSNVAPSERHLGMMNDLVYAASECFSGTTCNFTFVGLDEIPASALNFSDDLANDWPTRRELIRKLIGKQVNFTRSVYPPQPPLPSNELAQMLSKVDILTRDEYRQRVSREHFELVTIW